MNAALKYQLPKLRVVQRRLIAAALGLALLHGMTLWAPAQVAVAAGGNPPVIRQDRRSDRERPSRTVRTRTPAPYPAPTPETPAPAPERLEPR